MKRFLLIFAMMSGMFIAFSLNAHASGDKAGTVVAIRGEATAQSPEAAPRTLSLETEIHREDTIRTGKRGRLQIMFLDNTIVSMGSESELKVAEYEWNSQNRSGKMKTQAKEGVFRIMGGAITKTAPQNFITETPAATIGVRGSLFSFKVDEESLTVLFEGGKGIDIMNGQGVVSITQPGFGTQVMSLVEAPRPAVQFSEDEMAEMAISLTGGVSDEKEGEKEESAQEEKSEEKQGRRGFRGEERQGDTLIKNGDMKPPVVEVEYTPKGKLWNGFFSSVSAQENAYTATGKWGLFVDTANGSVLGGGIPLFGTESETEKAVLFRLENIQGNTNGELEADLKPDRGEGQGVLKTSPIELQDVWNSRWGYVDASYGGETIFYYWITGRRTPEERITDLIARSIIGRYRAGAHGIGISATEGMFLLHNGLTDLLVDFGKHTMNGQIAFDEITLKIAGANIFPALASTGETSASAPEPNPGEFFASVIKEQASGDADTIITIGHLNGMFFGDNGNSLGGNFNATQDTTRYLGIFGGNQEKITGFTDMSGKFMGGIYVAQTASGSDRSDNRQWYGDVSAKRYMNLIDGVMEGSDGESFSFRSYLPDSGEDSATYTGSFSFPFEHEVTVDESGQKVNLGMRIFTSNLKEFAMIEGFHDALVLDKYTFDELVFFGVPSVSVPEDGVFRYDGLVQAATGDTYTDDDLILFVNWKSGKALGIVRPPSETGSTVDEPPKYPLAFMTGDLQGTQIANGHIFGFGGENDKEGAGSPATLPNGDGEIIPRSQNNEWIDGTIAFSQFYGSQNEGFGMTGSGTTISYGLLGSTTETPFRMITAGFKDPGYTGQLSGSQTGTADWSGFAMGIAQHTEVSPALSPDETSLVEIDSHTLMNDDPASFRFTVEKDTGTIREGFFTLTNMDGQNYDTYAFHFGEGKTAAVWIDPMTFAAELGSETQGQRGFLVTDTFKMIPETSGLPVVPEYISWGYWGASYGEAHTGEIYTSLVDKCFWIAGERTPQEKIQELVAANITGSYGGGAYGSSVDANGLFSALTNGHTQLEVDFGSKTVSGRITFDQVQFSLESGAFSQGAISAQLSGTDVVYGQANGAFFGPNATVAAGTFKADMANNVRHMGVFLSAGNPQ